MRGIFAVTIGIGWVLGWGGLASGDVFVLSHGGRVEGEWLTGPSDSPETCTVRTPSGALITLDRSQIVQTIRQRPEQLEYEKLRPRYPDTVEGHWTLAEWCRDHNLPQQRKRHLERILELDPNHVGARSLLGYSQVGGQWKTHEQTMQERGYVRFEGSWRLPQEVQLILERRKKDIAEKEWIQKLNRWRNWLGTDKAQAALEAMANIKDPMAVKAILYALRDDPRDEVRVLLVETLARLGTPEATRALMVWALEDPLEEVRLSCLDHLRQQKNPDAVAYFIGKLKSPDNETINRAAVALKAMGDPTAIGPLIDALVTTHRYKVQQGNPGQMSMTFPTGGSGGPPGFSFGGSTTKIVTRRLANRPVLDALEKLSGGVNYGFDVATWKAWYASQKRQLEIDARRG